MTKILQTILLCLLTHTLACAKDSLCVTFSVRNAVAGKVAVVYNMTADEMTLSDSGQAKWTYGGADALYAKVYYGENFRNIYLERGDSVNVSFDAADFQGTCAITGGKEKAITYLNQVKVINLPDDDFKLPFADYLAKAERKMEQMKRLLRVRKLAGECGRFEVMEGGRITYFYACSLLMYPISHAFVARDTVWQPDEAYYAALRKYVREDERLAEVQEYRDYMIETAHIFDPDGRAVRDPYRKLVAEMAYLGDHIESDLLRQRLIFHLARTWVDGFGVKDITDMENLFYTYVTDPAMLAAYKAACGKWNITAPGRPSPDFQGTDINGKTYTLKDFRGKYLYIDMWATWCGPCRQELPYLKQLEAKYSGRNITFLSLSIDSDKAKWEEKVRSGTLAGTQLLIGRGSKFQRDYGITGIPHFILLDPQGRIVNPGMTRPSSDDTEKILNSLSGL